MNAKELRIGNYLQVGDEGFAIYKSRFVIAMTASLIMDCDRLKDKFALDPIPLTEEWLVRFGFEKREASTCVEWYKGENEVTRDWLFSITWLVKPELINAPNAPFYRNGRHTIYYVHQLQNLYFALTGEELELKDQQQHADA